ncbi:hypothetical protein GGR53DRAFT_469514 [Hypoxylon sp. FL1150]|nr:hypothetical protein GGR53DRAFT_469514 [Hypoxylon sp. FL1150]
MAAISMQSLHDKLDDLYAVWQTLDASSPPEAFANFARAFFARDCTVWLASPDFGGWPIRGRGRDLQREIRAAARDMPMRGRRVDRRTDCTCRRGVGEEAETCYLVDGRVYHHTEKVEVHYNDDGLITEFKQCYSYAPVITSDP